MTDAFNRRSRPRLPSHRDHISKLPDDVIHRIFSFLSIADIVKTSILSKRWMSTWRTIPELVFDGDERRNHRASSRLRNHRARSLDFQSIVDSVLSQHASTSAVKKFHINDFLYMETDSPKLDGWLLFAKERNVEDLRVGPRTSLRSMYKLPEFSFGFSGLVRLQVSFCCFSLAATDIKWPCLKILSMSNVSLSDVLLARILRGSPLLESLDLGWCVGLNNINVDSTSVRHLLLTHNFFDLREIRTPHLLSLRVAGNCSQSEGQEHMSLEDMSSLVEAELDFEILPRARGDNWTSSHLLKELLEQLCGVRTITIGDWCLQILSLLEMRGEPPLLLKCQNLTLHGLVSQWDFLGIAYSLRSSQCLEKLVIHLTGRPLLEVQLDEESKELFNFDEEDFTRRGNFEYLAKHLKRVEIIGFEGKSLESKHLLALIKFLLGYALVLEELIIKVKLPTREGQYRLPAAVLSKLLAVSNTVNSFRRASKNAVVILDHPLKKVSS